MISMPRAKGTVMPTKVVKMFRNGTTDAVVVQGFVYINKFSGIMPNAAIVDNVVIVTLYQRAFSYFFFILLL